ncbi:FK506-binding protein 15-like [Symsagittifera roscoffensis]|uniref:FK506-binding protein 15-like n=1 Tax=Symsagittifera roscoffensis TaxID=84072 RepID=UPI00307C5E7B
MKQPLIYTQNPHAPMMHQNHPFDATISTSMAAQPASSSIDQTTANNMQMVMLESKQVRLDKFMWDKEGSGFFGVEGHRDGAKYIHLCYWVIIAEDAVENDLRSQVMQVSSKLDQVQQKVEVLASRDTPFGTGNSRVSMEAAVLMQKIHRVVQENERLKKESDEARATVDCQTEKKASLLAQNQKYLEQSNIMLEQRNESFQSVSSASQIKITQLEQEKTQILNELNSLNNKVAELQFDLSTHKQRQLDFKAQVNEEALGKNQMREDLDTFGNRITELEEDVAKLMQAYREQRAARKAAESKITELEEQVTGLDCRSGPQPSHTRPYKSRDYGVQGQETEVYDCNQVLYRRSGQGYDSHCGIRPHVLKAVVPALTNQETTGFKVKRLRGSCRM